MNAALIPVRGGSKSIPLKNIKLMCGKPLVYWVIKAACECEDIDEVYVSTDSGEIQEVVHGFGLKKVKVISRSDETATDIATTESVMLEFAEHYKFDNIVLIQATSPLLQAGDLKQGFLKFYEKDIQSVLSVVRQKRFNWKLDINNRGIPANYDIFNRPRRQNFDGYFVENGAFYITSYQNLLESKNRISGNIGLVEMDEESFYEIDEVSDWEIVESLLQKRINKQKDRTKKKIKMFLTDCDGCLTDGGMGYTDRGEELKIFNAVDGMAFALLRKSGIITGIITGEDIALVKRRSEKLKTDILRMGVKEKGKVVLELCQQYGIDLEEVAYVGDDINDLPAMRLVGYPCSVNSAQETVKREADYVARCDGGRGAIREIVNKILEMRDE